MSQQINWLDDRTATINNGHRFKFTGIIKGSNFPAITYTANSVEEILEGLILDDWIYCIEEVYKMELHYFTFGMGHVYAGHVQPILAKSEEHAHIVMFRLHGNKWAFHYTEQEWNAAKERGAAREIHLDLIDARKVVLDDYVR